MNKILNCIGVIAILLCATVAKSQISPLPAQEPDWTKELPVREVTGLGRALSDIDGHMPAGHIYRDSDKITWGHETTHGIHSRLRQKHGRGAFITTTGKKKYFKSNSGINCLYVLENRAAIIKEPNTTMDVVAENVPRSLRGGVFKLYLIQQRRYWNDTPLYIFDEWVAYGNGAAVKHDLNIEGRVGAIRYALEFNVYAMTLAMTAKTDDPQFKRFLMWNLERTMELYKKNGPTEHQKEYLRKMRTSPDGEELRNYIRGHCGPEWTQKYLGF